MLSTVAQDDAQKEVMSASIPTEIIDWLIEKDALYRLYTMSRDLEHAG